MCDKLTSAKNTTGGVGFQSRPPPVSILLLGVPASYWHVAVGLAALHAATAAAVAACASVTACCAAVSASVTKIATLGITFNKFYF